MFDFTLHDPFFDDAVTSETAAPPATMRDLGICQNAGLTMVIRGG